MERTGTGVVPGVVRIPVLKTLLALVLQMRYSKTNREIEICDQSKDEKLLCYSTCNFFGISMEYKIVSSQHWSKRTEVKKTVKTRKNKSHPYHLIRA